MNVEEFEGPRRLWFRIEVNEWGQFQRLLSVTDRRRWLPWRERAPTDALIESARSCWGRRCFEQDKHKL